MKNAGFTPLPLRRGGLPVWWNKHKLLCLCSGSEHKSISIWHLCACFMSFCAAVVCLYHSPFNTWRYIERVCPPCTKRRAFCSLPQVGNYRMTAVKSTEEGRGWGSVMDNDSQQACARAQPQALDSSPAEVRKMPARRATRGWGESGLTHMYDRSKVTLVQVCVNICVVFRNISGQPLYGNFLGKGATPQFWAFYSITGQRHKKCLWLKVNSLWAIHIIFLKCR